MKNLMVSRVWTAALCGVEAREVVVEADLDDGMPFFSMVGFLSSEVREAQDRVRTAMKNAGIEIPACRITVNLSPVDLRKSGSWYDLPIACAVLGALGAVPSDSFQDVMIAGELGLSGHVNAVRGIMEMVLRAREIGCRTCIIPDDNLREGSFIEGIRVLGVSSLPSLILYLQGKEELRHTPVRIEDLMLQHEMEPEPDFRDLKSQPQLRRAAEIAVSGLHNFLMVGPPGSGKTMTARRIPSILPRMSKDEMLEISRIHSIAGLLPGQTGLMMKRPFRAPHHTISPSAMAGGGLTPMPGEITLAHRGVLFLDEIPQFRQEVLEILRQPMEEGRIAVSRLSGKYVFPADFMLIAAMNGCRCGFYPDRNRCRCQSADIRKYLQHISRPLLDRIDICAESSFTSYEELSGKEEGENSAAIRERVERARRIQQKRYEHTPFRYNSDLSGASLAQFCPLGSEEDRLMRKLFEKFSMTGRTFTKILKVARTIADLEGETCIRLPHISEAVSYRTPEEKFWF